MGEVVTVEITHPSLDEIRAALAEVPGITAEEYSEAIIKLGRVFATPPQEPRGRTVHIPADRWAAILAGKGGRRG